MDAVRTICPYCGVGCGIVATPIGERAVTIAGDPAHPANRGRLCSKGTQLGETVGLDGRLLKPMIGARAAGWDEALDLIAARFAEAIAEHGPDSVAFYVSGQLLTEDYYVANKLMKGFIGSANIDTNSRLCMASAAAAHVRAFGEDLVPACYADLDAAEMIVLVGSNTAWCHPVVWQRIEAARAARGTRLVVIDPRRTETAEGADLFLPIRSGSDVALFNGLLSWLVARGEVDPAEVARRVVVPEDFWTGLGADGIGAVAAACDVAEPALLAFFELFAANPRTVTLFSQGINQSLNGTDQANSILNLHLATGRIGRPGAAPFSITGQPNAMGGREVGGFATTLAAHMDFTPANVDRLRRFWQAPAVASEPGLKAVDLFEAVGDGRIKALWVIATNPAVSMPNAGRVREALARCPFLIVSDIVADTDTARLADVRLPALAWGEKDGTVTNSERRISRQRSFFAPPGEAKADWWTIAQVARRLGHGDAFAWAGPAAIFREHCALTRFENDGARRLDLGPWADIEACDYDALEPFQWGGRRIGFAPGEARLVSVAQPPLERARLIVNSGRYRDQWHSMTRTGLSPRLSQHRREPLVELHPLDAARTQLQDGDLALVGTAQGRALYKVAVTDAQRPGEAFVPIHWTDRTSSGGRAGLLPDSRVDPISGQPGFKRTAARIAKVATDWRGFLIVRDLPATDPQCRWWTKVRVAGGWLVELAGDGDAAALEQLLPDGDRSEAIDSALGSRRRVVATGGRLEAALFVTRSGALPPRDWLIGQLAGEGGCGVIALLAARPPGARRDEGETICACFAIGERTIQAAIAASGLDCVEAVGSATGAGTNCGSCRPAIARLLVHRELADAAE